MKKFKNYFYIAQGWSIFTSSVTKAAKTATESAVRYGGIATQKVSEMASTVTEKVCIFLNKWNVN